jgi:hypothetical protein
LVPVQFLVPSVQQSQHIDVAGFIYAVLGVAYAALLGLMVAALTLTIAPVLFIVEVLDYPLRGDVRVRSDAFLSVLDRFETSTLSEL